MNKTQSKKQPKTTSKTKTQQISLDQLRAVVGGTATAEESRK